MHGYFEGKEINYFTLNIETCNENSRNDGDPLCSSKAEIND